MPECGGFQFYDQCVRVGRTAIQTCLAYNTSVQRRATVQRHGPARRLRMRGTARTRASAARMAERGESSDDEPTIAEDVVVTKYKMAGDMANRTSPPALTLIRAHYTVAEKVDCVFPHYIVFSDGIFVLSVSCCCISLLTPTIYCSFT